MARQCSYFIGNSSWVPSSLVASKSNLKSAPTNGLSALWHGVHALERMGELTALTGRAERIVLAARRGGVETRDALGAIDAAVDAQIGLEVLVHGFDAEGDAAFAEKHAEGLDSARAALAAGRESLDELAFRRRGLAISLIFIAAVAVGLALKIREIG